MKLDQAQLYSKRKKGVYEARFFARRAFLIPRKDLRRIEEGFAGIRARPLTNFSPARVDQGLVLSRGRGDAGTSLKNTAKTTCYYFLQQG